VTSASDNNQTFSTSASIESLLGSVRLNGFADTNFIGDHIEGGLNEANAKSGLNETG